MCDDAFNPLEIQESILIPNTGSQSADSDYGSARLLILALSLDVNREQFGRKMRSGTVGNNTLDVKCHEEQCGRK